MRLKENKKMLILFIVILLVLIDQIIKQVIVNSLYNESIIFIKGLINFTYVENTGGAFGIGRNSVIVFILANIIIIGCLIKIILSKNNSLNLLSLLSMAFIISGGIGNLIDRIFRGFVVDYIDINPIFKYPVFNLADIFIVLGCIVLAIELIINKEKL